MFTGIVEERGEVVAREDLAGGRSGAPGAARLTVRGPLVTADARDGDSIAVNGVCLTVTGRTGAAFTADVMAETLVRSTLGRLRPGAPVNLERAATLQTRLGGHLLQGHVDAVGTVLGREPAEHWEVVRIGLPPHLARYVVEKGSIAVDGISLTVVSVGSDSSGEAAASDHQRIEDHFTVSLIPTTLERTTLGGTRPGEPVNLEVDVVAKYVERLLAHAGPPTSGDAVAAEPR